MVKYVLQTLDVNVNTGAEITVSIPLDSDEAVIRYLTQLPASVGFKLYQADILLFSRKPWTYEQHLED